MPKGVNHGLKARDARYSQGLVKKNLAIQIDGLQKENGKSKRAWTAEVKINQKTCNLNNDLAYDTSK